jgi:hypothetical protein
MKRNAKSSHSSKNNINAENIKLPKKTIGKTQGVEQQRP